MLQSVSLNKMSYTKPVKAEPFRNDIINLTKEAQEKNMTYGQYMASIMLNKKEKGIS